MTEKEIKELHIKDSITFALELCDLMYDDVTAKWLHETQSEETIMRNVLLDCRDMFLAFRVKRI